MDSVEEAEAKIETCPSGAITSIGHEVHIDANVCTGCGRCASVCPTGAAKFQPAFRG